ncbi:hypothetical protein HYX01_02335 [Candidatus Woesearchaeota archaeon]|nr:hypothetical protein [Candidatus Woesearchaeota archaeon]
MSSLKIRINAKFLVLALFSLIISVIASNAVFSHGNEPDLHDMESKEMQSNNISEYIQSTSVSYILTALFIAGILVLFSLLHRQKTEKMKIFLFFGIAIPIVAATFYLAASTIYLNQISETKGPVHWHADYEIYVCNKKIELLKPKGFSNSVGIPLFHEHDDNRIHVEGVVTNIKDVSLHNFFEAVNGYLEEDKMGIPTDYGFEEAKNSELCGEKSGKLQVFLYKIRNPKDAKSWIYEQIKLGDFENYVLAPYSQVPPGDCIIIEFGEDKEKTENMCSTYKAAIERGELNGD